MFDTRDICDEYGPGDTFPYNREYLFYEQYAVFERETSLSLGLSCAMVFLIVILLTADIITAVLVLTMVGLVVLSLMGTYHLWDEHLNSITMTNAIIAIGISVDHSVHLA